MPLSNRRLTSYVRSCARALGLRWTVSVVQAPIEPRAQIARNTATTATIEIGPSFWRDRPRGRRLVIAHELMHLVTWSLADLIPDSHASAREHSEELLVDTLAAMVAPWLPPFPTGEP